MKKIILKLILSALLTGLSSLAFAAKYYAAPNGTGTGTSLSDPCEITSAWGKLSSPGDTLFLRGGVYYINSKQSINKTGSSDARICIFAYPGETPILDYSGQAYGDPGISLASTSSYMHIKGITIRYAGDNGILNQGNNTIIENCTFYGNCDTGLQHKLGGGNLIKNCDSYANFDYKSGTLAVPDFGGNADGFADKQFTNTNPNTYDGCRAWNNSDDGWDFFQRVGHTYIKNSVCYNNGPASYNMTNHPRATVDAAWFANFTPTQIAAYTNYGNGNGFKIGGEFTVHDVTLTNCLSVGHKKTTKVRGFDQNNNAGSVTVYNCSAYDNAVNYGFYNTTALDGVTISDLTIKNCVGLAPIGANTYPSDLTSSNNSWNTSGVTLTTADFISMDTTVILTARQADGSLPNIVFMQIADGSDLIDKGVNVGLPYSGTAPDLGCFEKGTLDNFPGAVTTPTNATQTVVQGVAITPIVFTWSAGATGLTASGLPNGIVPTIDNTAKTLTLSGAPSTVGVFNYTITTEGGTGTPATVSGKIISGSATAQKIAYVTTPNSAADALILDKLQSNTDFLITIIDASATNTDYSNYDLILISSVPNSSSAGLVTIEDLEKPKLLLKPFTLGSTRWNWGVAANTAISTITVTNKTHEIFTGLTFTGSNNDELTIFSAVTTNGVTGITSWFGTPAATPSILATPLATSSNQSIIEIPINTEMGPTGASTTVKQRFLMIGVSEYSTANLTTTATQLIENSCYYLMGMTVPSTKTEIENLDFSIAQTENEFIVKSDELITGIELVNIAGSKVSSSNTNILNTSNINNGIYIAKISTKNKQAFVKVLIK